MTMIACTINYNNPFMIGDIIFSSSNVNQSIQLPTNTIDINHYLELNDTYPRALYQKIYILKNNLCIGFTGDSKEMQCFLEVVIFAFSRFGDDEIHVDHVMAFIKKYDFKNCFFESSFFILLMDRDDNDQIQVREFRYPDDCWNYIESDIFGGVYAGGTGADTFLEQASAPLKINASENKNDPNGAICVNAALIARLLAIERISLHTVNYGWGGGFETIFYDGQKFIKLDEIAYVVSDSRYDEKGDIELPVPRLVMHYRYFQEILFISCIEIQRCRRQELNGIITITSYLKDYKINLYVVPRIDVNEKKREIALPPDFSFQTKRIALGYGIIKKNVGIYTPSYFSNSGDLSVVYKDRESVQIIMNANIDNLIKAGAKEAFQNV